MSPFVLAPPGHTPPIAIRTRLRQAKTALKREFEVYRRLAQHEKTPRLAKFLLATAIGYVLLPFDLIPDFIPIIGQLDDAIIVPALVILALRQIPTDLVQECRAAVETKTP